MNQALNPTSSEPNAASLQYVSASPHRDQRFLLLAMGLSLVVHLLLALGLYNKALGRVDLGTIKEYRQVVLVHMPQQHMQMTDAVAEGIEATQQLNLTALSQELLKVQAQSVANVSQPDRPMELRDSADPRPENDGPKNAAGVAGPLELPQEVMQRLLAGPSVNLPEVQARGSEILEMGQQSKAGGAAGGGDGYARDLLAGTGFERTTMTQLPKLERPAIQEAGPRPMQLDAGAPQPALPPQSHDLIDLALRGTTAIPLPEVLDNDFDYVVRVYDPRQEKDTGWFGEKSKEDQGYLQIDISPRRSLQRLKTMPKDVVLLIDTSESVPQMWVDAVTRGVTDSLNSLNPGDRFNIVLFNEKVAMFNPQGMTPYSAQSIEQAAQFLQQARSAGYTDVNQAMARLMVRDVAEDRVHDLILISDGRPTRGVLDTRELINLLTRDNNLAASIYCVGIGRNQNRTLLEFLAYRNKGYCVYADEFQQAPLVIRDLMSRLRYPILKNVTMTAMGLDHRELFPHDLPNIHQGETFSIFGRFGPYQPFTMRLQGSNMGQPKDFTFTRDLKEAKQGPEQIAQDWAFWKLHHLYSEMIRLANDEQVRKQIDQLRRQYKLKTLY